MTIDTSREAVERLLDGVTEGPWSDTGTASEQWSVDYDGDCGWRFVGKKRQTPVAITITKSHLNKTLDANTRFIAASRDLVPALLARAEAAEAEVARLSHAIAAETAKREAMEEALTGLLEPFGDDPCRYDHHGKCQEHFIEDNCCVARARATLAKHGSK